MEKICVLYFPNTGSSLNWYRAPLGFLSLGASLEEAGYKTVIVDGNCGKESELRLLSILKDHDVIFLGISAMTGVQILDGLQVARSFRELKPDTPIIWGGWHPTLMPQQTIKHDLVDIVVKGLGEENIVKIASCLKNGEPLKGIPGILYKKGGLVEEGPEDKLPFDVNAFPRAAYHLIDVEQYITTDVNSRTLTYISSRGCPYRCGFCAVSTVYKRRWLRQSAERVIDDIEYLIKTYKVNGIRFEDSNFFTNRKRVRVICEELIRRGCNIKWSALARPEELLKYDDELLMLVKESGCNQVLVGSESGDQDALDLITKDNTVEDTIKMVELCNRLDISLLLSYMVGLPVKNCKDVDSTLNVITKLYKEYEFAKRGHEILLFYYTPYPGSALYRLAVDNGLKVPQSFEAWGDWTLNVLHSPWITEAMNKKILKAMDNYAIIRFYVRANQMIFNRTEVLVKEKKYFLLRVALRLINKLFQFRIDNDFFSFPLFRNIYLLVAKSPYVSKIISKMLKA